MITLPKNSNGSAKSNSPSARTILVVATLVSLALTFVPGANFALYPLVLFTTIIHEGGHAIMTVLTGGGVQSIGISPDGSGVTYSVNGISWLVYMAGYLGATLFGALALHVGRKNGRGKRGIQLIAAFVLGVTLLWIHPWSSPFGFIAG